jgi:hypothetical protein
VAIRTSLGSVSIGCSVSRATITCIQTRLSTKFSFLLSSQCLGCIYVDRENKTQGGVASLVKDRMLAVAKDPSAAPVLLFPGKHAFQTASFIFRKARLLVTFPDGIMLAVKSRPMVVGFLRTEYLR